MMKKSLLVLCTLFLVLAVQSPSFAADRVVLFELCTSTTCGPCVAANSTLNNLMNVYEDELAIVRYHAWWPAPGNDPFYLANVSENTARINYYDVNAVPDGFMDGADTYSNGSWNQAILNRSQVPSPLNIDLSVPAAGEVKATIEAEEAVSGADLRVHFVITESNIAYTGTNGDPMHHQAMRDMLPNANGHQLQTMAAGDVVEMSQPFTFDSSWNEANLEFVVFVQNHITREVYQAAKMSRYISMTNAQVSETAGDGDGVVEAGETGNLVLTLESFLYTEGYTNVLVELSTDDPDVQLMLPIANFPNLDYGEAVDNSATPYIFSVAEGSEPHEATFQATIYTASFVGNVEFDVMIGGAVGIEDEEPAALVNALAQNRPNPFNPSTQIRFSLAQNGPATLQIFDPAGRLVKTLVDGHTTAGSHEVTWDGTDNTGTAVASGVYLYQLRTETDTELRRMVLMK